MFGLYDREGILRFSNPDKEVCLEYANLFELGSTNFCLINLVESIDKEKDTILDLNQEENSN